MEESCTTWCLLNHMKTWDILHVNWWIYSINCILNNKSPNISPEPCPTLQKSDVGYPVEGSWRGFMFHKRDSSMADGTQ